MKQFSLGNVTQLVLGRGRFEPMHLIPKLTFVPRSQHIVIMTGTVPILPMRNKLCANKKAVRRDCIFNIINK